MFGLDGLIPTPLQALGTTTALLGIYLFGLAFYRLYLSPLAKFPGPRLAAVSLWYEFYYDVVKRGQYTWRIREMHEKYGPIVRINPYEIHIDDPDYYDELYTGPTKPRDKWAWSAAMFGNSTSHFGAVPHEYHKMLRAPLNPFFSKQSVAKLEPMIKSVVEKFCARLRGFQQSKQPVNLRLGFAAVTMDVVTEYAFANCYNCLDAPNFAPNWPEAVNAISEQSHMNKQFPWLLSIMKLIPLPVVAKLDPNVMELITFQMQMAKDVAAIMAGKNPGQSQWNHPTIFHELIATKLLPDSEKTLQRLVDEGQTIVAAGQVTTTHYLNTTAYHILANPDILQKLKAELGEAMPDRNIPSMQKLEKLPYLNAVVLEGFRISYGVTHRLQRVSPKEPLTYQNWVIPPGTPISMTSILMHENPEYFPDPKTFNPDRWLMASSPGSRAKLEKCLVNFSKGTRGCLGQHLAQAEIYLTLAGVFGRFDMELYHTSREDIDVAHDFFNPQAKLGSEGLRVIVK